MTIVVQVNGKVKSRLQVPIGASEEEVKEKALADGKVQQALSGRAVARVVVVPGRLVNIVV